jgi:hypothetical protein
MSSTARRAGASPVAQPSDQRPRNVYRVERWIIDELLYRLSYAAELPFLANTDDLLGYLRTRGMVIICGPNRLDLEPVDLETRVTPATAIPRWDDSRGG